MRLNSRALLAILLLAAAPVHADKYRARRSYDHSLELFLAGDFKKSLLEANNAIDEGPALTLAHAQRARVLSVLGDDPSARKDADRVIAKLQSSLSTLDHEELVAYGSCLLLRGQTEHALPSFNAALELDPKSPEALAGRARVWRARGEYKKAVEDLTAAIALAPKSPLYLYSRANNLYDLGKHDAAISDLTAGLRVNKKFHPAFGLVGAALASKGDFKRATAAYNKSVALNPEYAFGYLGRAAVRLAQGNEEAAFADLDDAVRVAGASYAPYYNRAEAFWRRGNRDEALADYRRALNAVQLDGNFALKIGDRYGQLLLWREAVEAYSRAYALGGGELDRETALSESTWRRSTALNIAKDEDEPKKTPAKTAPKVPLSSLGLQALLRRSRAYEGYKDAKRAMADLDEAVERRPESGEAWAARGTLALRQGLEEQAVQDLNQAVRLDPKNPSVRVQRGSLNARRGRAKLALEDFNAAIEADPKNAEAYNSRGVLQVNAFNDVVKGLKDVQTAVEFAPKEPGYLYNLGMVRLKIRDYYKAIEHFNAALKNQGPPARILGSRADAHSQLGDHAAALEDIQVALEKDPKLPALYDTLGLLRLRAHDYEQAVRDFNQALELERENVPALVHRGQAYGALGSLKAARRDFERAVELSPDSREALTALCQARRLLRDPSAAVRDCSRAIELDPYHAPAYLQRGLAHLALRNAPKTIEDVDAAVQLGLKRAEGYLAQAVAHAALREYKESHASFERARRVDPAARSPEIRFWPPKGSEAEDFFNAMADLEPQMRGDVSDPWVFLARGDAFHNAEHYDKAVVEYTKAMELDGNVAAAYAARGLSLSAQEAFDAAQQDFLRAIEIDGSDADARARLGTLLTLKRQYKAAAQELGRAAQLDAKNAEAWLRLGNAQYFLKNYKAALGSYEQAVKADPFMPSAHNGLGLGRFALREHALALESFSRAIALGPNADRFHRNRASTYTNLRRFSNAAAEFKAASFLNGDPALVDEYKKLIEESENQASSGKS